MKDVSIIIVNYNTKELTLNCLQTLYKWTSDVDFEVILVDNASTDGSIEAIRKIYPEVNLIASSENLGFGRANNLAAKTANSEYTLLLNSDVLLVQNAVKGILDFARSNPGYGCYGGKTLYEDGSHNTSSCWGFPTFSSLRYSALGLNRLFPLSNRFNAEGYDWIDWKHPREVDAISGCFLLMRDDIWKELGGFDEDFFMYGEDIDLALRLKATGRKCIIDPSVEIIHLRGKSDVVKSAKWIKLFTAKSLLFHKHWEVRKAKRMARLLTRYAINRRFVLSLVSLFKKTAKDSYDVWKTVHNNRNKWEIKKILAIASGGGHWIQLLRLRPGFKGNNVVYVTTIRGYREGVSDSRFYSIIDANQKTKIRLLLMAIQVFIIVLREHPQFVISTGAAPGYFALLAGKLLGAKTIWIDSIANAEELSLSGKKIGNIADLYTTQWKNLELENGPIYLGAVL